MIHAYIISTHGLKITHDLSWTKQWKWSLLDQKLRKHVLLKMIQNPWRRRSLMLKLTLLLKSRLHLLIQLTFLTALLLFSGKNTAMRSRLIYTLTWLNFDYHWLCIWFGSCENRRLTQSRSSGVLYGWPVKNDQSVELNWVKRRTSHEPNWLNWVRIMWSTAFDPGLTCTCLSNFHT